MTQGKAQTVASAAIGQGFAVRVLKLSNGQWIVEADGAEIDVDTLKTFADNQSVEATVNSARLI